jgi:nucleotide-binding universal stress UspA family protein
MKNIVIAIDATQHSVDPLALGKLLGEATKAPLIVAHAFDDDAPGAPDEAERVATELATAAGVTPADYRLVPTRKHARELQRITEEDSTGVLVIGSTTKGRLGRLLAGGGVGDRLLGGAACPVAVAPHGYAAGAPGRLSRIGVAYDGSEDARIALDAAHKVARAGQARIRLLSVFERAAFGGAGGAFGAGSVNRTMRAELERAYQEALADAREGLEIEGRLVEGSASDVLVRESADLDLLVMGSRGFGPSGAVLLGGTTAHFMRNGQCPALVTPRDTAFDLN